MKSPVLCLCFFTSLAAALAQPPPVQPHSVPWEFASDRYGVTVNGKPVTVFFASMNLHFAGFDSSGQAEVRVAINENDCNRVDGKSCLKPDEF